MSKDKERGKDQDRQKPASKDIKHKGGDRQEGQQQKSQIIPGTNSGGPRGGDKDRKR